MRIGRASKLFSVCFLGIIGIFEVIVSIDYFQKIPYSNLRIVVFLISIIVVVLGYLNLGIWIHEKLHRMIYFKGKYVDVVYNRKMGIILNGYCRIKGNIKYRTLVNSLISPGIITVFFLILGILGFVFSIYWYPLLFILSFISVQDMCTDIFWCIKIRKIKNQGKYWDNGEYLDVVWKTE